MHQPRITPQKEFVVVTTVRARVNRKAIVWLERLGKLKEKKKSVASLGIEIAARTLLAI
jgi:hypothetical protein